MPTYQYACTQCDERLEAVQAFTDEPLTECPVCGGRLRKVFSAVGVVFKGSGFYKTDSRSGNGSKDGGSSGSSDKGGSSESGSSGDKSTPAAPAASGSNGSSSSNGSGGASGGSTSTGSSTKTPAAKTA